jgi:hypothetical protein
MRSHAVSTADIFSRLALFELAAMIDVGREARAKALRASLRSR